MYKYKQMQIQIQILHGKIYTVESNISIISVKNRKEIKPFWFDMYTFQI